MHTALSLALANLQLVDPDPAVRLAAVRLLGETGEPLARTRLENLLQPGVETDTNVRTAAETSLTQVKRKAINQVVYRILIFYVGALTVLLLCRAQRWMT